MNIHSVNASMLSQLSKEPRMNQDPNDPRTNASSTRAANASNASDMDRVHGPSRTQDMSIQPHARSNAAGHPAPVDAAKPPVYINDQGHKTGGVIDTMA